MAPSRLRGALSPLAADIWTYLPECRSLHRCWAPRCQSLLAVAVRHAVLCACSFSRQKGKDGVDPTSSVWLDAHFSSPACLTPAHCLKCVSGALPRRALSTHSASSRQLKMSVLALTSVSATHSVIHSIWSAIHSLFFLPVPLPHTL